MSFQTRPILRTHRAKKDGTYPIAIRLTIARSQIYFSIGQSVTQKDWDEQNMRIRPGAKTTTNTTRLNNYIIKERAKIDDVCLRLLDHNLLNNYAIKDIKKFILWCSNKNDAEINDSISKLKYGQDVELFFNSDNSSNQAEDLFSYLEQKVILYREARRESYAVSHENLIAKLKDFHKKDTLPFREINFSFLNRLEAKHLSQGFTLGGLGVYLRTLKARFNDAIKENVIDSSLYPFKDYKIKAGQPERKALSDAGFKKFQTLKLEKESPRYRARNLFLASFYMRGMNFKDMAYLKVSNITPNFKRLAYRRRKTGKPYNIAIHPKLKAILLEFLGSDFNADDYVFPILTHDDPPQSHRRIIKAKRGTLNNMYGKIGKIIGEKFSFYSARHTYATMSKRRGVPTSAIQEALGHSLEKTTQVYLDSFEDEVIDAYDDMVFSDNEN